jgi:ABC-2 type transport system ATP-binding protein
MIEIENLKFGYRSNKVLFENLNLSLAPGFIHGLLGKNGAGKTTLLKQITGLVFPDKGSCRVLNFDSRERSPEFLKNIFIVPEEFELPALGILRFLDVYAPFYPSFDYELFNKCLVEFEISDKEKIQNLSFGQKKKVLLSVGIAANTKILLLDEPTNGLDIPSKSAFKRNIANILNNDRLIVISTHQVRDLENLIDSIIVLNEGKIIFNQTVTDISEKLSFKMNTEEITDDNTLYTEKTLGGYYSLMKNKNGSSSKIDIELLFNGIIANYNEINEYFKTKI